MEKFFKRSAALVMTLIICIGILNYTVVPTQAASVDYVYAGKYIKNWGVREVVATFLSPNAIEFYEDNNTSLEKLMSYDGSSTISGVPASELYQTLKTLMVSNHSHITDYAETRSLYQYTDCQNSGKTSSAISSFYSGKEIGPAWDSGKTWNREHVWPNSKGDLAGNGENDIMMLRPTSVSENGSRSNKAYGTTSSYYNPNNESGGQYDLRGDVSRIILYQYVRWGCINTGSKYNSKDIFGTQGIIESLDILLLWMEEDPVDTWELGRNDSVESITGTRNVFVDYPELAFILFGKDVPAGYQSPSGSMEGTEPVITVTANNSAWGKVSVDGNVITAAPAKGYTVYGYTIVNGSATLSRNGDSFTVDTNNDVTVRINFAPLTAFTVSFVENGSKVSTQTVAEGEALPLPSYSGTLEKGHTFIGWAEKAIDEATKAPAYHKANSSYAPQGDITLYALYSYNDGAKTVYSTSFIKDSDTSNPEVSEPETSTPETGVPDTSNPEVSDTEVSDTETSVPEESNVEESGTDESKEVSGEANESNAESSDNTNVSAGDESTPSNTDEKGFPWYIVGIALFVIAAIIIIIIIAVSKREDKKADINRK